MEDILDVFESVHMMVKVLLNMTKYNTILWMISKTFSDVNHTDLVW